MNQRHNFKESIAIQIQYVVKFFVIIIAILQIIKKYELICKKRNHHKINDGDLKKFLSSDLKNVKNTACVDCGSALQLSHDNDNDEIYWIKEI